MTDYVMRQWVKSAYTSSSWKQKVNNMPPEQVTALYHSLLKQGKLKGPSTCKS